MTELRFRRDCVVGGTRYTLVLRQNGCIEGWGPGCDSYTGGHLCERGVHATGRHRCVCGATRTQSTQGVRG